MNPNYMNNRSLKQKRTTPSLNQIYHLSRPKQEIIKVQSKKEEIFRNEKITEIYKNEFEDYFPNILLISKEEFLKEISIRIELIIKELFTEEEIKENSFKDYITESNKIINEKYQNNYNILSKSYENYLKRPKHFSYLKHFRKHCIHTDDYAYHSCEYENSKLIEIKDEKKKNEITHFICSNCKKSYFPNQISLICNYCKINYFSCLLNKDEDPNIQPATWEKYHCQNLINETMKCLKCKNILYLNIRENKLICLNKKCNFTAKPQSIIWNCLICKKEFKSDAKIYNPLEIKIMKRSVHLALIFKKPIFPNEIPCCKANPRELIFYHKKDCKGELFEGNFNEKIIIVCSKCHAVNFYDKFIWTCPLCKKRFRTNNFFIRSNTNDKFTSFRTTELNSNFSNYINNYNSDYNPMLRSTSSDNKFFNTFHSTLRFTTSFNDNKNHIVNLVTEIYPNSGKKNNDNSNDKHNKNKKQYSTLIEILAERNNNKMFESNNNNYNILLNNNSNNNSRINSRKNKLKKNKSEMNLEEDEIINNIAKGNNNKENIIIVNNNNENNNNDINLNLLRKIASVSTNDHSLSNKSYGNSSNPPTNRINKITVNKNENNNEEDESILNMNNQISKISSRRLRNRKENDSILNNENKRRESKFLEEENSNNNSQISIKKQLEFQVNKITGKSIREKERENKKEKSQEIYKKPNKEIDEIQIDSPDKNLNTLIPNKKKRKYNITPQKQILKKNVKKEKEKEKKDNENNEEEEIFTSPEQLKEVIKNGKIPSFKIENFIFKNPIGEGSFGKIYLIEKEKTHEKYALKKIICHDLEEIKHFQKEFELVYSKVHNNIMKIYNIEYKCLDSTTYSIYVLMELANSDWNNEIKRRLKKREYYTESEIVKLLNQILDALIFLEKNGIAHRDIKPQNILIYPNNIYKVADFGEARNLSDSIQECTLRGSELYMSPVLYNCLKNRQSDVIHNAYKSDVFSLGFCLLYAMVLTVKVLNDIREINNMNVISLIIKKALRRNYSVKMQGLINGMLELDENKRFSFEDIKKYLKENF